VRYRTRRCALYEKKPNAATRTRRKATFWFMGRT